MLPQIELFCVGFAAVVDTVLLLVVLERTNRPLTAIWLKWTLVGATLWHVGSFLHALLRDTEGPTAVQLDAMCMVAMACGLLLLNCGILHAGLRINRSGAASHPPIDFRYVGVYVPSMLLIFVGTTIVRSQSRDFIAATSEYHVPYLIWLTFANLTAAWLFLRNRNRFSHQSMSAQRFLVRFSVGIIAVTILVNGYLLSLHKTGHEPLLRLLTNISPLVPTLVFAYYVFRRRLLPMVFERTLAYGAILLAVFYLHRLTISPLMSRYSRDFEFDFVVIEGLLLIALILAYQPLRTRFRESLLYLVGDDVAQIRDATRQLSVELSRRADDDIEKVASWFTECLRTAMKLRYTGLSFAEPYSPKPFLSLSDVDSDSELERMLKTHEQTVNIQSLFSGGTFRLLDRSRSTNSTELTILVRFDLIAVLRVQYRNINGFLLLGSPTSGDRLSDEQLNTLTLLADQFAAVVHNRQLENARQTAERRAVQQEKLSTLGLVAGSLAHELRNPLSSIRTIATLLGEDLSSNKEHTKDIELIVSEIDRLTQTTQRLLDFSRVPDAETVGVSTDKVIHRIMDILNHLAKQHGVSIKLNLQLTDVVVGATDASLSEILFNLIKNAIEAVRDTPAPQISISTALSHQTLKSGSEAAAVKPFAIITVCDNGAGIPPELQDNIFEAFVTGKSDGTGLGLYLVGERVRELGGTISCKSQPTGTSFEVNLPVVDIGH